MELDQLVSPVFGRNGVVNVDGDKDEEESVVRVDDEDSLVHVDSPETKLDEEFEESLFPVESRLFGAVEAGEKLPALSGVPSGAHMYSSSERCK